MDSRFDDLLHTIVVEKGQGIYGLFDVVFGFLYKRTDFFYEMAPGENMGFFPGQAEAVVYNYFRKYQNVHYKERVPKRDIDPKEIEDFMKKAKETKANKSSTAEKTVLAVPEEKAIPLNTVTNEIRLTEEKEVKLTAISKEEVKPEDKKPQEPKKDYIKFESISTYNGDSLEKYNWSQGVYDVTIQFKLPENTTKKDLKITVTSTHLKILVKQQEFFDADFCEKVKSDEANWTIEDNKNLVFYLDKAQEVIWKSAFKGDKEIDTTKVDNSKKIEEFDNDTQAALNKIIYEQNRKKNGLPTTEEEKKLEAMKEAWNKPDSPFRGQPFDPSMFNLNEPIYFNTPDYEAKLRNKKKIIIKKYYSITLFFKFSQ